MWWLIIGLLLLASFLSLPFHRFPSLAPLLLAGALAPIAVKNSLNPLLWGLVFPFVSQKVYTFSTTLVCLSGVLIAMEFGLNRIFIEFLSRLGWSDWSLQYKQGLEYTTRRSNALYYLIQLLFFIALVPLLGVFSSILRHIIPLVLPPMVLGTLSLLIPSLLTKLLTLLMSPQLWLLLPFALGVIAGVGAVAFASVKGLEFWRGNPRKRSRGEYWLARGSSGESGGDLRMGRGRSLFMVRGSSAQGRVPSTTGQRGRMGHWRVDQAVMIYVCTRYTAKLLVMALLFSWGYFALYLA